MSWRQAAARHAIADAARSALPALVKVSASSTPGTNLTSRASRPIPRGVGCRAGTPNLDTYLAQPLTQTVPGHVQPAPPVPRENFLYPASAQFRISFREKAEGVGFEPTRTVTSSSGFQDHLGTWLTCIDAVVSANLGTYSAQCLKGCRAVRQACRNSQSGIGRRSVPFGCVDPCLVRVVVLAAVLLPSGRAPAAWSARRSFATWLRARHLLNRVPDVQSSLDLASPLPLRGMRPRASQGHLARPSRRPANVLGCGNDRDLAACGKRSRLRGCHPR